jgi:hypothetical protein
MFKSASAYKNDKKVLSISAEVVASLPELDDVKFKLGNKDYYVRIAESQFNDSFVVFFNPVRPMFSAFTGTYKTGERIKRTYQGLKDQTYPHWEWVVIDDSPSDHTETWDILQEIASKDSRVKVMKILPVSGGNVGEVKHRAASLCNGLWLFELDHDDKAISTLFEDCLLASNNIQTLVLYTLMFANCMKMDK